MVKVGGGDYVHSSIRDSLEFAMETSVAFENIAANSLQFNTDGLTLLKSSSLQLWPILGRWVRPNSASLRNCPSYALHYARFISTTLRNTVQQFAGIYGAHHLIYNFHGAIHIADDVLRRGPLDSLSSFPVRVLPGHAQKTGTHACLTSNTDFPPNNRGTGNE
ncbi:hypothetical protein AHF37_02623 [Paragonimus kellicotti]|nr:hypothetical protein AHF37_02623 [Paragonimus kellicotti]